MKKIVTLFLTVMILVSLNVTMVKADEIPVFYNGEKIVFDVDPAIINGRTMVPMRAIFETFGASVSYNPQTKQIIGTKESSKIILNIGNTYATVNRNGVISEYTLDAPPVVIDGRTLVPLRFIGDAFGATVNWNGITKTVTIISNQTSGTTPETRILTATEIAKLMEPKSVIIYCYNNAGQYIGQGSGFFINSSGYIATNYHVVKGAYSAIAKLSDGSEYDIATIIHTDEGRDLAVVKIERTGLPYVILGKSELIETGNKVYAYGSPLGISNTLSEGIVSNKNVFIEGYSYVQISSPVSPGSSGGAVVDEKGDVIGVVCSYLVAGQNMNLAIPVQDLKTLLSKTPLNLPFSSLASGAGTSVITYNEVEPNNSIAAAQNVDLNCYVYGIYASESNSNDMDYYAINVKTAGWLAIGGIWSDDYYQDSTYTEDLLLSLLDSQGNYISISDMEYGSSVESFKYLRTYLNPGTYYIYVSATYEYRWIYANEYYLLFLQFE